MCVFVFEIVNSCVPRLRVHSKLSRVQAAHDLRSHLSIFLIVEISVVSSYYIEWNADNFTIYTQWNNEISKFFDCSPTVEISAYPSSSNELK